MNDTSASHIAVSELNSAFDALKSYDTGSPRGMLRAVDQAIIEALPERAAKMAIESRLVSALKAKPSAAAAEYICSKLALCGSEASVPVLAKLLSDPVLSTVARNALEQIPGNRASKALRQALGRLRPAEKAGAVQSLGVRRDLGSVSVLAKCLAGADAGVARAAAAAMGEIGSPKAAGVLEARLRSGSQFLQRALADAALVCAERLAVAGYTSEARSLYESLLASVPVQHVQQAASRGLAKCAVARSHSAGT